MKIDIHLLSDKSKKVKIKNENELSFGKYFTDHMFIAEWKTDKGWFNLQIKPYAPFILEPSALVFHYGQEIFEGLKAYKWEDGSVALFRPEMNAKRFNASADRLCMPHLPEELFLEALEKLIAVEADWIPKTSGTSLYIRPTMIAVESVLGVKPSAHYYFFIILSPVGAYYPAGFNPIALLIEDTYVRASLGGTGEAKTGGNYASSLKPTLEAKKRGFDQVLWLDSKTRSFIEEGGAMNIFFVYEDKIVTPPLEGSILHGITRDSLLKLGKHLGCDIREERVKVSDLLKDIDSGNVKEAFCSGTAAIITPVNKIAYKNTTHTIGDGTVGRWTEKFYQTLIDIQYGKMKDPFGWVKKVSLKDAKSPSSSFI